CCSFFIQIENHDHRRSTITIPYMPNSAATQRRPVSQPLRPGSKQLGSQSCPSSTPNKKHKSSTAYGQPLFLSSSATKFKNNRTSSNSWCTVTPDQQIKRRINLDLNLGCLGCCSKPPLVISVDEPSKRLKFQGQRVKKRSLTEDFWSHTSGDMDNRSFPSHRSISSISTSNQTIDSQSNADGPSNPSEFTRQQWIGVKGSQKNKQTREPKLSWNATYENLLGTNKSFPQPIPLAEMVDFLVDVWEQEGLYD
ncbi:A-kinase anchor protein 10, partial [Striga asiatica]